MPLDSAFTQNLNLRVNGDQLLAPLQAYGREIGKITGQLERMLTGFSKGQSRQDNQLRAQVQVLQRLVGEAGTLQKLLASSNRPRNSLLSELSSQAMGKKVLSASRLKQELSSTKTAADALELRLAQLHKSFDRIGTAGRKVSQRDINKALNTEQAMRQVRLLDQELQRIDARQRITGKPLTADAQALRDKLGSAQSTLLTRIQSPNRSNWTTEITQVETLTKQYAQLTRAEQQAAIAAGRAAQSRIRSVMQEVNLNEAQLRGRVNRSAGQYSFTPDQARTFNVKNLNRNIDAGIAKLQQYQGAMARAVEAGKSTEVIGRLSRSFENLKNRIAEAAAQKKAFDALPESRMKALNEMLFGGGGAAFATRIAGASLITAGVFGALNALSAGARQVIEFEDALSRLQAIAGATDIEMKTMADSILTVARNSRYSTVEITEAATQIAQAGFSAAETATVLQSALSLATASGTSPSDAVDTLTSALGAFQLQATESVHIVDVLVEGLNRTKLSISQMQAALQYAGATAKESGVSFEELVAVAGSMANAGIRSGSTIGTGLRQLIVDLQSPTENFQKELANVGLTMADVDVKALGLAQVVKNLSNAGFTAEQAYEGFEVRAASAFLALRGQIDSYDQLALSLANTGAAQKAQERASDSLSAKWQEMLNRVNELIVSLSGGFTDAMGVALDLIGGLASGIAALNDLTGGLGSKLLVVAAGFAVGGPWGAAIAAVTMLVGELRNAGQAAEELEAASNKSEQKLDSQNQTIASLDEAISKLVTRQETLKDGSTALQAETINLTTKFEGLSNHLRGATSDYDKLLQAMLRYRGEALRAAAEGAREVRINAQAEVDNFGSSIRSAQGSLGVAAMDAQRNAPNRNDPAVQRAVQVAQAASRNDYASWNTSSLTTGSIDLQAEINNLKQIKNQTPYITNLITKLQTLRDLIDQIKGARSRVSQADFQIGVANSMGSAAGQQRDRFAVEAQSGVDRGLRMNEAKEGSGDALLSGTLARARARIKWMQDQLAKYKPDDPQIKTIGASIATLEAQVARVTSAQAKAGEAPLKDEKAAPGENLSGAQVAGLIKAQFKGANPYSYNKRSYSEQVRLYDLYKSGRGALAAKPGNSRHGSGNALDMTPIKGMDMDQVTRFLESRGLEITEALNERNPATGRYHWHFAWKPKTSSYIKSQNSEQDKAAKELEDLLKYESSSELSSAENRIREILNDAKGGKDSVGSLNTRFAAAEQDYTQKALANFDVEHPVSGLGDAGLKQRGQARASLQEEIKTKLAEFHSRLWGEIADYASKEVNLALAEADRAFEERSTSNQNRVAEVVSQGATLNNGLNRNRFGAGAAYRQQQNEFDVRLSTDRDQVQNLDFQGLAYGVQKEALQKQVETMPQGEARIKSEQQMIDLGNKLFEIDQKRNALQLSINERTRDGADSVGTLKSRLQDSVAAWADNSGIMDTWSKNLENNVGPALDMFTNQLATLFTSIIDGTRSIKQALGDFIKAFAQFVIQIIAKALALMAVKAILSAFGLKLTPDAGGVVIGKKAFNGGPVEGKYAGGEITRGVRHKDSALYNLAKGEYVVNNKAVSDLGLPFMDAINKEGLRGLSKMTGARGSLMAVQAPRQETNVWLVQEKFQAPMGKNDVLVTIHEDILTNGPTKKLIRQVSQGG